MALASAPAPATGRPGPVLDERVVVVVAGVLAVVLGWLVTTYVGFTSGVGPAAVLTLSGLVCAWVIMSGPVPCLAAIAALAASGLDPGVAQLGEFNATAGDIFWAGLAGWWLLKVIDRAVRGVPSRPSVAFGQVPAIAFFAYAVLALLALHQLDPGPLVSLLRVIHTFLLAFLAASMIESRRDLRLVLAALVAGAVTGIVVATFSGGDLLSARAQGELGKNPLGLVSGVLLLLALFSRWSPNLRYPLAALAVFGLVLAKSVASFVAAGVTVAVGAVLATPARAGTGAQQAGRVALAMGLAAIVVFTLVQVFRPEQLPGSEDFDDRSATQRIVVAAAGIEIFERNPIVGVGWRQSTAPEVIGDREIATEVRRQFPDARPTFFPDVTPASVHNTYIQILADLGLIGFTLFAALLITLAVRIVALLRRLGRDHDLYPETFAMSLCLLAAVIWHNETPLFGGQAETVIPVLLVGMIAAVARMTQPRSGAASAPTPAS